MNNRKGTFGFLNDEFSLLDRKQDRYLLILICLVFSIVFLNIFVAFNINRWYSDKGIIQFLRLSSYGLVVSAALLFTQFPLRQLFKLKHFRVKTFLLWVIIEIVLISFIYIFLYGNPLGNFMNDLVFSVKYTLSGICLPYSFALLLIHYKNHYSEIKSLQEQMAKPSPGKLIGFKDEKGKIRFSVLPKDLLFLESADNYVCVYFLLDGKKHRKILRNSLKNLEEPLKANAVLRCHRSFIVNTQNVEMAQKEGKKLFLKLKQSDSLVPVSSKYFSLFSDYIS
jgi:hypothetical protein